MFGKQQCVNSPTKYMTCVLARNLKGMERRVSPTASHATVLLIPTQKFIRQLLDTPDAATEVYESFHVLEALPTRWSPIHLFKCDCRTFFTHPSCAHVLLASMVCGPKIENPLQYVTTTFQVRRKRGRPARSGKNE